MNLYQTLGLATAGIVWLTTAATAQRVTTNPTAVPNTVSTPTFQPDTLRPSREQMLNDNTAGQTDEASRKNRRAQRKNMRRNGQNDTNSRMNRTGGTSTDSGAPTSGSSTRNTSPQDAAYREGASSNGTTNNNSNTTNYNSNSVMTAPTSVGSNPNSTGTVNDARPGAAGGTVSSGSTMASDPAGNTSRADAAPNLNRPAATGTGEAISSAEKAPIVNTEVSIGRTTVSDFIAAQPDYTTLQNAFQSVELDKALKEGQAYTVFAPSNNAFKKLPAKTQNVLLNGENRDALKKLLSYHVVQGKVDSQELTKQINAGSGTARLKTLNGATLTAKLGSDGRVMIMDEQGNTSHVDMPDKSQSNGVIHGIDKVLMPKDASVSFR